MKQLGIYGVALITLLLLVSCGEDTSKITEGASTPSTTVQVEAPVGDVTNVDVNAGTEAEQIVNDIVDPILSEIDDSANPGTVETPEVPVDPTLPTNVVDPTLDIAEIEAAAIGADATPATTGEEAAPVDEIPAEAAGAGEPASIEVEDIPLADAPEGGEPAPVLPEGEEAPVVVETPEGGEPAPILPEENISE